MIECHTVIPAFAGIQENQDTGRRLSPAWRLIKRFGPTPPPVGTVAVPLIAECYANLDCRVVDTRLVNRYNFFVLEVQKARVDPARKDPRTLHRRGRGHFMIAGETVELAAKAR